MALRKNDPRTLFPAFTRKEAKAIWTGATARLGFFWAILPNGLIAQLWFVTLRRFPPAGAGPVALGPVKALVQNPVLLAQPHDLLLLVRDDLVGLLQGRRQMPDLPHQAGDGVFEFLDAISHLCDHVRLSSRLT